mmetsp:Transcript_64787/g.211126  ORF Transcript_64787/g.211126 Transcript_64787/m.211126 type:complete len:280 (+) Transcript_64787:396-1235(+)
MQITQMRCRGAWRAASCSAHAASKRVMIASGAGRWGAIRRSSTDVRRWLGCRCRGPCSLATRTSPSAAAQPRAGHRCTTPPAGVGCAPHPRRSPPARPPDPRRRPPTAADRRPPGIAATRPSGGAGESGSPRCQHRCPRATERPPLQADPAAAPEAPPRGRRCRKRAWRARPAVRRDPDTAAPLPTNWPSPPLHRWRHQAADPPGRPRSIRAEPRLQRARHRRRWRRCRRRRRIRRGVGARRRAASRRRLGRRAGCGRRGGRRVPSRASAGPATRAPPR